MMFDKLIQAREDDIGFLPKTLAEIIFAPLPHRNENCEVIFSHIGEQLVTISLTDLRIITNSISERLTFFGLKTGDTILLASFSSSNELANALIFTAATCMGIRVFVPIFPEPAEFENWKEQTCFACVIMPFREILQLKNYEREKEVIYILQDKCKENEILFLDSFEDFNVAGLIQQVKDDRIKPDCFPIAQSPVTPQTEAVIFTTSGSAGISKLLVYTHEGLVNCCQAWQKCGLFSKELFGNPGFSPLFTHTIGIRSFINSIWSGNPFCIVLTDWVLHKPEVVRYLLLKMKPGHLIAGPAFYNTMLELFRQFPELKAGMNQSLKAAISIGAPFDETTAAKFKSATGVALMNGFGTTETLMVLLNKPEPGKESSSSYLGEPLPGVTMGLKKTDEPSIYELFIRSVFQSARTLGEQQQHKFFETGDLVAFDETTGEICFHRRKSSDFIKDEYGVKIPLNALHHYYEGIYGISTHIEWIPLVNIPGLAALIFLPEGTLQKEMAALIKNTNEDLKLNIEPFEYSHRHIERFSLVFDEVPLTRKGTVSKDQIYKKYGQIIAELRNPFVFDQKIETAETGDKNYLYKFSNPNMAELLEALKLDKVYVKGEGETLFYQDKDKLQSVLDFVGGFGANLLGHNHPRIREAIIHFLDSGYPALNNQGSQYYYPALLARELNRLFSKFTGKYFKVLFGNSGTEATEIALHHAYFEWRQKIEKLRDEQLQLYGAVPELNVAEVWDKNIEFLEESTPCIIVLNNCFHGYTSGARSLLNHKKQRYLFSGLMSPHPLFISDLDADWKIQIDQHIRDNVFELQIFRMKNEVCVHEPMKFSKIIASIIEPVRGEGGIYELNPALADLLARQEFPLISDEIQCGLGRTGSIPSYKRASYYLLGKSLGGGIEKISAVLIDDDRFRPTFTKYFNSTFANGELAACLGLSTLKIIEEENLTEMARDKGEKFLSMLREVSVRFPEVIESVNGKGLMIGIHFNPRMGADNNFLRILIENEVLGYFFSGWFLNNHFIRVLPSLSKPNSLRIEPSFYVKEPELQIFCQILDELCVLCSQKSIYELCKFLMNGDPYPDKMVPVFSGLFPQKIEEPAANSIKAGFIGNFTMSHRELQVIEPDLQKASDTGLRILFNRLSILMEGKPIKIISKNLLNRKIHFTFYVLPFDTSQMEVVSRWGKKRFYIAKIQDAVNKLTNEGMACISLGAHTSIITGNGLNLAERGNCKILTGNSLTVASCLFYLDQHLESRERNVNEMPAIAIVGASGNIGTGLVNCLNDPKYAEFAIILIGNNEKRLEKMKEELSGFNKKVTCTTDLFELKHASMIISCANTNDPIIFQHHIRNDQPVFIIDISVPSSVSDEVKVMQNICFCKEASSVYLPGNPELLISSHTPEGKIFCCAAESILCALYDLQLPLKGHINKDAVRKLIPLALEEGFFKTTQ